MAFSDLVAHFGDYTQFPIKIDEVRDYILERGIQDVIEVYPVALDTGVTKGQFFQFTTHDTVYGDPKFHTVITVANTLNPCWTRFVICKELVHIFDSIEELTGTADQIEQLTMELAAGFPEDNDDASDAFWADRIAEYKALAILVPGDRVKELLPAYLTGQINSNQVATFFRIPEAVVPRVMSEKYLKFYYSLIEVEAKRIQPQQIEKPKLAIASPSKD